MVAQMGEKVKLYPCFPNRLGSGKMGRIHPQKLGDRLIAFARLKHVSVTVGHRISQDRCGTLQ